MIEMKACRRCGKAWKEDRDLNPDGSLNWREADWTMGYHCRPCYRALAIRYMVAALAVPAGLVGIGAVFAWLSGNL